MNGDGFADLVLHFSTGQTGIAPGDAEACVTGLLPDDTPFRGCQEIITIPRRRHGPGERAARATCRVKSASGAEERTL